MTPEEEMQLLKERNAAFAEAMRLCQVAINANCARMVELQGQQATPTLEEANAVAELSLTNCTTTLATKALPVKEVVAEPVGEAVVNP